MLAKEEERERLRKERVKLEIREEELDAKIEKVAEAIEEGKLGIDNISDKTSYVLSKEALYEIFKERPDAFAKYYFAPRPDENYDGIVKAPNSKLHWWLYDRLAKIIKSPRGTKSAVAAPRGGAKSMVTSVIFVIWCIVFEFKKHIVIVSDTSEQSEKFLQTIKHELETNLRLAEDFPRACGKSKEWRIADLVTTNGVKVDTYGMGGALRGTTYKGVRPDLVILDDIENDEHVQTKEQRKKADNFLNKKILKLGNSQTDYFLIGTILHYESVLAHALQNPAWYARKFRSVMSWSTSNLWDKWEETYMDLTNRNREKDSREFFEANQEEMLKGTEVLWPEYEPYINLMEMRIGEGVSSFNSEKQNDPIDPEEAFFLEEDFQYYVEKDLDKSRLTVVGAVDPSLGRDNKANASAIMSLGKDKDGYLYVLDADIRRRTPDQTIKEILRYHQIRDYQMFAVDANVFQEFFKDELAKTSRKVGLYLPCKGIKTRADKKLRIEGLQPLVKAGMIKFKKSQYTLISQFLQHPLGDDDGPDALQLAVGLVRKSFKLMSW